MTVAELIAKLQQEDQDAEVRFAVPSHDYWRNVLAEPVRRVVVETITPSQYHRDDAWKIQDECEDRAEDGAREVVVIRD